MMRRLLLCLLFLVVSTAALAAMNFPSLTGHVVDDAHLLSAGVTESLEEMLAQEERSTGNQVVVVTVPMLRGMSIQDYGYQLGRAWGIGQKGKNNGVLLILAPQEHQLRIEVGYGLEGVLTDALSSEIIHGVILPHLRARQPGRALTDGAQAILNVLDGRPLLAEGAAREHPHASHPEEHPQSGFSTVLTFLLLIAFVIFAVRHPFIAYMLLSSTSRYGGSSSGDSGWSGGGGGSFGGGGASGSW